MIKFKLINIDSEDGNKYGFTSDKYTPDSTLYEEGEFVWIMQIASIEQGRGYFKDLIRHIEEQGKKPLIYKPNELMQKVASHMGFVEGKREFNDELSDIYLKQ